MLSVPERDEIDTVSDEDVVGIVKAVTTGAVVSVVTTHVFPLT